MKKSVNEKWEMISRLNKEFDDMYHKAAHHYGFSDSAFWIMYTLYENRQGCTQKEICSDWYFSKQTINSAITELEKKGYITRAYEDNSRKSKKICLTPKGTEVAENTVEKVIQVENTAFEKIDEKEMERIIQFFQMQLSVFRKELDKII